MENRHWKQWIGILGLFLQTHNCAKCWQWICNPLIKETVTLNICTVQRLRSNLNIATVKEHWIPSRVPTDRYTLSPTQKQVTSSPCGQKASNVAFMEKRKAKDCWWGSKEGREDNSTSPREYLGTLTVRHMDSPEGRMYVICDHTDRDYWMIPLNHRPYPPARHCRILSLTIREFQYTIVNLTLDVMGWCQIAE